MVAPCQRFTHQRILALKFLSIYVHRSTLPQSRIRSTAPSEREPGQHRHNANHPPAGYLVSGRVIFAGSGWEGCFAIQPGTCETVGLRAIFIAPTKRAIQPTAQKPQRCGRFSSPLRKSAIQPTARKVGGGGFFGHGGWECLKNGQMWGGDWNSGSEGGSVRGKWAGDGVCYCQ